MSKNLRKLFFEIHSNPIEEQHSLLADQFKDWQGDEEQIDDVLVMGIKVK